MKVNINKIIDKNNYSIAKQDRIIRVCCINYAIFNAKLGVSNGFDVELNGY